MRDKIIKILNSKDIGKVIVEYTIYKGYSKEDIEILRSAIYMGRFHGIDFADIILHSILLEFSIVVLLNSKNQSILYY